MSTRQLITHTLAMLVLGSAVGLLTATNADPMAVQVGTLIALLAIAVSISASQPHTPGANPFR